MLYENSQKIINSWLMFLKHLKSFIAFAYI